MTEGRAGDAARTPEGDARDAAARARAALVSAIDVVRGRLTAETLPLGGAGVDEARVRRRELLAQIDDYLLPRLRSDGAPLLVVVGGSTGAGKSTLVNSLLGAALTTPGVLRPTTRSPVLVFHPADAPWFAPERVLPNLVRIHTTTAPAGAAGAERDGTAFDGVRALRLAPFPGMPPGLALLDAPDIDSIESGNRELAGQLLAAADLWLFVTTAARYADAVPWDLLRAAAGRRAQLALVLDRIDPGSDPVVADLQRMMQENGLGAAPLFVVPEAALDDGMLPEGAVADVAGWLTDLGGSADARDDIALATRDGVVDDLCVAASSLADAVDGQAASAARLTGIVTSAYADARAQIEAATTDGAMLRGEVLDRWQDFVGASAFMRSVERGVSRVRDAVVAFFRGGEPDAQPVELAIAHGLEAITIDAIETARERVRSAWRGDPAGSGILIDAGATAGVTGVGTAELRGSIGEQIRGWQGDVLDIVREQGAGRRGLARGLSLGVNGLGVALMLVVFGSTGGLTGIEVGVAGGTAVLAQKVLEAVFGDDAVRRLTGEASRRLTERLGSLIAADAAIALTAVAALGVSPAAGDELRDAVTTVERAAAYERASRVHEQPRGSTPGPSLRGASLRAIAPSERRIPLAGGDASTPSPPEEKRAGLWQRLFGGRR
ncbi:dynamin family protein [Microbacterium ulmi]|uniref:ABC transporter n=1 Tax=Microbacterium ulmi TaxID=179095 RepID=A0A7Y2LWZ4_9MICO|nr:dynamin family protein [Microbacterium ulmi]NII71069.1 energy-coupling factor transporter ATP-binding protein EcfA2 [Microbacterium ulmi]NNH02376.1 ABC transporter [Microbacterium ulmi]